MHFRYEPAWQIYEREENPSRKAEAVIDNRDIDDPRLLSASESFP